MKEPNNASWIVPGLFIPFVLLGAFFLAQKGGAASYWALALGLVAFILLIATVQNNSVYFAAIRARTQAEAHKAFIETPKTLLALRCETMHPETARLMFLQDKTVWMVKQRKDVTLHEFADFVLFDAPIVHIDFVLNFLNNCSDKDSQIARKGLYSENSKILDPDKIVTDRAQYDALIDHLYRKGMITKPYEIGRAHV
jgi:hypothetical protein